MEFPQSDMKPAQFAHEEFTVAPWVCMVERIGSGAGRKMIYLAIHEDTGETVMIDFAPRQHMTVETFQQIIDLGFPEREGILPLSKDHVELMWWRRFGIKPGVAA